MFATRIIKYYEFVKPKMITQMMIRDLKLQDQYDKKKKYYDMMQLDEAEKINKNKYSNSYKKHVANKIINDHKKTNTTPKSFKQKTNSYIKYSMNKKSSYQKYLTR